ncbi:lytic polysaccharide monooxygenase [Streptomyces sp. JJ66]|uniref:lytic polysaccharide monooxygenase auxiliary activity family 9 protein n=1 Tax=Streptomyces sp. JJ66 TaxID=2803843 RepID=UPI001C57FE6B|nr:lytic polysaccharide monooxygenase [Streptomyces sp. JJ66]MBW1602215.1 lytic polysaccharide monooxygenase [Streptomyces sp. JJ66]
MTARRTTRAVALTALGVAPLALTGLAATPAVAHGSLADPVSRVAACYAEGPESPDSAACKAAIAASGTQAFYDWNEVNIGDAAGRHREIIPDGELCSAGREKYRGLDLPRADWPATAMNSGTHTFRYTATAPHKGSFELYITKDGYDPTQPLTWADLEPEPFAKVTEPKVANGAYSFSGDIPEKSGRHLIYSVWQRSDSPEAFYTCSDVTFGGDAGAQPGGDDAQAGAEPPAEETSQPSAPTREQIEAGREESTVSHDGHGGDAPHEEHGTRSEREDHTEDHAPEPSPADDQESVAHHSEDSDAGPAPAGGSEDVNLAETGADDTARTIALGGTAALAVGTAIVLVTLRRRAAGRHRA